MIIPVATSMVNGIPIHILTRMIENLAQTGSLKNGIGCWMRWRLCNSPFKGPLSFRKLRIKSRDTNCGTAIVITKSVRQTFLYLRPLVLSKRARTIPKKKVVAVAATAQIKVQPKSGKKVLAMRPEKTSPKLEKPTQSKSDLGAGCLWSKFVKAKQII